MSDEKTIECPVCLGKQGHWLPFLSDEPNWVDCTACKGHGTINRARAMDMVDGLCRLKLYNEAAVFKKMITAALGGEL
jgi:hypothetical protein